jgi:hypothetical protein
VAVQLAASQEGLGSVSKYVRKSYRLGKNFIAEISLQVLYSDVSFKVVGYRTGNVQVCELVRGENKQCLIYAYSDPIA